jgi:hypothetical protein
MRLDLTSRVPATVGRFITFRGGMDAQRVAHGVSSG